AHRDREHDQPAREAHAEGPEIVRVAQSLEVERDEGHGDPVSEAEEKDRPVDQPDVRVAYAAREAHGWSSSIPKVVGGWRSGAEVGALLSDAMTCPRETGSVQLSNPAARKATSIRFTLKLSSEVA